MTVLKWIKAEKSKFIGDHLTVPCGLRPEVCTMLIGVHRLFLLDSYISLRALVQSFDWSFLGQADYWSKDSFNSVNSVVRWVNSLLPDLDHDGAGWWEYKYVCVSVCVKVKRTARHLWRKAPECEESPHQMVREKTQAFWLAGTGWTHYMTTSRSSTPCAVCRSRRSATNAPIVL